MHRTFAVLFATTLASQCLAQQKIHTFGLYVSGIKAGTLQTKITQNGKAFSVSGHLSPSGILRHIHDVGYSGQSAGTANQDSYQPRRYSGHTKTDSRESQVRMWFNAGVPLVDAYSPERDARPYDIDPAEQAGTIDPLTAAATVFDDQAAGQLCDRVIPMFDGRRLTQLHLTAPEIDGDTAVCQGTYTRVAGFSPQDMQERVNFPFTLLYTRWDADTYRLMSFKTKTTFGSALAKRK